MVSDKKKKKKKGYKILRRQRQGFWSTAPTLTGCRQFPMAQRARGRQSKEQEGLSVSSCDSEISAQG